MGVEQAKGAFEEFLSGSITSGKRAILVIHGRGLSSPGEPVLKNKVRDWLTRSHWRKWVIAFSSAQCYDGGGRDLYPPAAPAGSKKMQIGFRAFMPVRFGNGCLPPSFQ